uniref:MYND-type domain-containing protein n=1 Tax=Chromera velia CCMP2878 TaxID=1169474 RepID=A0A0G4I7A4_9ALVE|mmetsp:Transcript_33784/g.66884  ORF Transcript_33784/g.66884 Transcript_33784/m.66884 type:complete len:358 (-) Transcript_33784:258-1331(-)|eukprot:Cvel_11615.t1-p1 / transcript=Cvel_11615.t1 / gene=Cvel_11615 / organism=Chromera_velia_CCMP2878 / gene_product=hypothetical protein / transcript_product=hypothetical protein / location=Cvel_scaffold735:54223-55293(+) / protein_length=357 / sequence_SO=supercontig / SO=protein_coding / is_pseudo=false
MGALKETVNRVRVSRERASFINPLLSLIIALFKNATVPDEIVQQLNDFKSSRSGDEGTRPLDFSHLLRAALWHVKLFPYSNVPSTPEDLILRPWLEHVRDFRGATREDAFAEAQSRAFIDRDADADALELFHAALSGIEWDGDVGEVGVEETERRRRDFWTEQRLSALACVLPNAAVADYINREKQRVFTIVQRWLELLASDPRECRAPMLLVAFSAWLQTALGIREEDDTQGIGRLWCRRLWQQVAPSIDLSAIPIERLASVVQSMKERLAEEDGTSLHTSFQPSRRVYRQTASPPCDSCGSRVPSYMFCTVCKLAVYCGKECQKQDWKKKPKGHKEQCARLKSFVTDVIALTEWE